MYMEKSLYRTIIVWIVVAVSLFATGFSFFSRDTSSEPKKVFIATRSDIVEKVSVTGAVEPKARRLLGFEIGGVVEKVYVSEGESVAGGALLARLGSDVISAQIIQAENDLRAQEAALAQLLAGTKKEEIEVQEAKVDNARQTLENARRSAVNTIYDAFLKADNAVRAKADTFFDNPRSTSPQLNIPSADSQTKLSVETHRVTVEKILNYWGREVYALSEDNLLATIDKFKDDLVFIREFLDELSLIVNALPGVSSLSDTTIATYKADIKNARDNINTALSGIINAATNIRTAQANLRIEEQTLALKKSPPTPEEVEAQRAKVVSARAYLESLYAQRQKHTLLAPLAGIVSKVYVKDGETVTPGTPVLEMISGTTPEVVAYIAETDIAKIKVGDKARITFDALSDNDIFDATVSKIDPAETVIEGVPTYKTTFTFISEDDRIKPGMTANIDVIVNEKKGVITVPARVIYRTENGVFVNVLDESGEVVPRPITLGIRGYEGRVEVVEGLSEGQKVLLPRRQ